MGTSALKLLLGSEITVVTALSLSAVGCLGWKSGVAFSADHLIALVLSSESSERRFDLDGSHTTASESQDQVEG